MISHAHNKLNSDTIVSVIMVLIYTFWGFMYVVIFSLYRVLLFKKINVKNVAFCFAFFLAILAFTQETTSGDLARVYHSTESLYTTNFVDFFIKSYMVDRYFIFSTINYLLYSIFGEIRAISFFWVFFIYYLLFLSVYYIVIYKKISYPYRTIVIIWIISVFSLVIFTQVTEIMKQAVAASIFIYSYTLYLRHKYLLALSSILITFFIHSTIIFFLPLFFVDRFKLKVVALLCVASFLFRSFNLMAFVSSVLGYLNVFPSLVEVSEVYGEYDGSFFSSNAPFFILAFWSFVILVAVDYIDKYKMDPPLLKVALMYVIILNLNYSVDHNFTRMLTLLYPFYLLLLVDLFDRKRLSKRSLKMVVLFFLLITTGLNYKMVFSRISRSSTYSTSFVDNSFLNLVRYNILDYLK